MMKTLKTTDIVMTKTLKTTAHSNDENVKNYNTW